MRNELNRNTYLLDGIPISSRELIQEACHYDEEFRERTIRFVNEAMQILKGLGHTVELNNDQPAD
jgi:hypothetical protein